MKKNFNQKSSKNERDEIRKEMKKIILDKKALTLWFNTKNASFGDQKPSDLLKTKCGILKLQQVIYNINSGIPF